MDGTTRPSILAVSALMTSSNLVDCTTGRSNVHNIAQRKPPSMLDRMPIAFAIMAADSPGSHVNVLAVGELKLFCISLAAFGIERAVCRLDILEALSGLSNGSSDSEIIGLSFDHQPISPGRKHEIGVLWT